MYLFQIIRDYAQEMMVHVLQHKIDNLKDVHENNMPPIPTRHFVQLGKIIQVVTFSERRDNL